MSIAIDKPISLVLYFTIHIDRIRFYQVNYE